MGTVEQPLNKDFKKKKKVNMYLYLPSSNQKQTYVGMMSYLNLQLNRPLLWQFEV